MSKTFSLNLTDITNAFVWVFLMAVVVMGADIIAVGDIRKVDYSAVLNAGIISAITGIVSLIKSFLTNSQGELAGIKIK